MVFDIFVSKWGFETFWPFASWRAQDAIALSISLYIGLVDQVLYQFIRKYQLIYWSESYILTYPNKSLGFHFVSPCPLISFFLDVIYVPFISRSPSATNEPIILERLCRSSMLEKVDSRVSSDSDRSCMYVQKFHIWPAGYTFGPKTISYRKLGGWYWDVAPIFMNRLY